MKKVQPTVKELDSQVVQPEILEKKETEEEPSWYHYVVVLAVFVAVGFAIYGILFVIGAYNSQDQKPSTYTYPFKVGNVTYNIEFHETLSDLEKRPYTIEPMRKDVWLSRDMVFAFGKYNGTDNGRVSIASSMLVLFFKRVYFMSFNVSDFRQMNESNCHTSTIDRNVITFNVSAKKNGVFMNRTNGCIQVDAVNATEIIPVTDKWILELINQE